jgi:hypothetical protein
VATRELIFFINLCAGVNNVATWELIKYLVGRLTWEIIIYIHMGNYNLYTQGNYNKHTQNLVGSLTWEIIIYIHTLLIIFDM